MTLAEMIAVNRENLGLSRKEFADKCALPIELISFIEEPQRNEELIIEKCAAALDMKIEVFKGEEVPEPTFEEKKAASLAAARFPKIRRFLLDPATCKTPENAVRIFGGEQVSLAERNLILTLSTNALYLFCDTASSTFKFHEYLFKLHSELFIRYEQQVSKLDLPDEEKQDLIDTARNSVFACDTMENIAIRIVEPFAEELEEKLEKEQFDFAEDLDLPFGWECDDELMKLRIFGPDGTLKNEIKLLSVKEREQPVKGTS
jgi:transcriptional regulator with XRE-family HTH domain